MAWRGATEAALVWVALKRMAALPRLRQSDLLINEDGTLTSACRRIGFGNSILGSSLGYCLIVFCDAVMFHSMLVWRAACQSGYEWGIVQESYFLEDLVWDAMLRPRLHLQHGSPRSHHQPKLTVGYHRSVDAVHCPTAFQLFSMGGFISLVR